MLFCFLQRQGHDEIYSARRPAYNEIDVDVKG